MMDLRDTSLSVSSSRRRYTTEAIIGARSALPFTTLGLQVPDIDVWAFGLHDGRVIELPPTS